MDEALIQEQERQLQKTGRYYKHVFWLCVPLLCMACYFYGARPLLLCGIALLTGNLCDRLVALLRHRVYTNKDLSNESFSLIIALLMPATVDIYVLVVAVLAGVLIGKEVFGGYGSYPFNPAAVGYAVAAVSWPEQVVRYPQPYTPLPLWNASAVPVSSTIEDTLRSGGILNLNSLAIALGEFAAPMGTGAALVILACGLVLWTQKDVHIGASASFLITCGLIAFFFPRQVGLADSTLFSSLLPRLQGIRDELHTGAVLFCAVFLLNEPYTCAHHRLGRILYGALVGLPPWASAISACTRPASALHCWPSTACPRSLTAPRSGCTVCCTVCRPNERRLRNEKAYCGTDFKGPRKVCPSRPRVPE